MAIRTVFIILAIVGIAVLLFAAFSYINASNRMNQSNVALNTLETMTAEQQADMAASMAPAMMARNQAQQERNRSLIIGGAGLVMLGVAWFGYDWQSRRPLS